MVPAERLRVSGPAENDETEHRHEQDGANQMRTIHS
jgi:hypothetical protein